MAMASGSDLVFTKTAQSKSERIVKKQNTVELSYGNQGVPLTLSCNIKKNEQPLHLVSAVKKQVASVMACALNKIFDGHIDFHRLDEDDQIRNKGHVYNCEVCCV